MKLAFPPRKYSLCAILLLIGIHTGPLQAQTKSKPAPAAEATLDVCHDELSGAWRYSGVVSVSGAADGSVVGIDYWIQNKTSAEGYADVLRAPKLADETVLLTESKARIARFSVDAAPLPLGTLRNASRIQISDPLAPASTPLSLAAGFETMAAVCGCPKPTGCVRTQGYWSNKPGVSWPAPYSRTAMFFSSGLTWQQLFDTPPAGGNGYVILAHQYMAALLNRAAGASAPSGIQTVISNATAFFASGTTLDSCGASSCATQKNWAAILDTYNNGAYPGAPGHCPE